MGVKGLLEAAGRDQANNGNAGLVLLPEEVDQRGHSCEYAAVDVQRLEVLQTISLPTSSLSVRSEAVSAS